MTQNKVATDRVENEAVQIVDADDTCPELPLVDGGGVARAVIWPGIGASLRSMHLVELEPGARTVPQRHPMEAVYYVIEGRAVAWDLADGASHRVGVGSMIFIEPETEYVISADGHRARFVGGPCPPDPDLYRHLGVG
jgi:quercetin dioxygenase-like cupin family protein